MIWAWNILSKRTPVWDQNKIHTFYNTWFEVEAKPMNITCPFQATALGEFDYRIIGDTKWKWFTAHLVHSLLAQEYTKQSLIENENLQHF